MKKMIAMCFLLLGLNLMGSLVWADIDVYDFSSEESRQRYLELTKELRCPKCQNQDIADSNAPIAQDMRREVHRLIGEGKSHSDVVQFMVERFGDFVSYKPKVIPSTYLLWYGPWVLILLGGLVIYRLTRRRQAQDRSGAEENPETRLNDQEHKKIDELLSRYSDEAVNSDSTDVGSADKRDVNE